MRYIINIEWSLSAIDAGREYDIPGVYAECVR